MCSSMRRSDHGRFRTAHGADLAARAAAAIEEVGAVGLEAADAGAARHLQPLEHGAALRVDAADVALVAFPGAVPQLAVDPGHAGDEAVGLDGAQDGAGLGIDLVDLAIAVLPDPQAALGPGEARVAAAGRAPGSTPRRRRWRDRSCRCAPRRSGRGACRRRRCRRRRRGRACARPAPLAGSKATSLAPVAAQTRRPSWVTPCDAGRRRGRGRTRARSRPRAPVLRVASCLLSCVVIVWLLVGALRIGAVRANLRERQRSGE